MSDNAANNWVDVLAPTDENKFAFLEGFAAALLGDVPSEKIENHARPLLVSIVDMAAQSGSLDRAGLTAAIGRAATRALALATPEPVEGEPT